MHYHWQFAHTQTKKQPLDEGWSKYNNTPERRYSKAMALAQKYLNSFGVTPDMEMHFRRPGQKPLLNARF